MTMQCFYVHNRIHRLVSASASPKGWDAQRSLMILEGDGSSCSSLLWEQEKKERSFLFGEGQLSKCSSPVCDCRNAGRSLGEKGKETAEHRAFATLENTSSSCSIRKGVETECATAVAEGRQSERSPLVKSKAEHEDTTSLHVDEKTQLESPSTTLTKKDIRSPARSHRQRFKVGTLSYTSA